MKINIFSLNNSANNYSNNNDLDERAKNLVDKALSCKAIKDFYEKAKAIPDFNSGKIEVDWTVKFVPKSVMEFDAECDDVKREIHLLETSTDGEALMSFIFELTNAVSSKRHDANWVKMVNREITSEEFTKESEALEYEGCLKAEAIMESTIQEMHWPSSLNPHAYDFVKGWNFERYWHCHQRFTAHAHYYRKAGARALGTSVPTVGLKEKLESALYLASHISWKDLARTLVIGMIGSIAGGIFAGVGFGIIVGTTCVGGALSYRILPPFLGLDPLTDHRTYRIVRSAIGIFCGLAIGASSVNERVQKIALPIAYALAITASWFVGYDLASKISS